MSSSRDLILADESATVAFGAALAMLAKPGLVYALSGPLGAGKTCLARGLIEALQPTDPEDIVSPTFTLVQTYPTAAGTVWHFDLYRLKQPDEVMELGFEDALGTDISLIEWPDRLGGWLPADRIDIVLSQAGSGRRAVVTGRGKHASAVAAWQPDLPNESELA
jgi:tRNA threonylcarbamoyladenosine biosynthesis protein TsaE